MEGTKSKERKNARRFHAAAWLSARRRRTAVAGAASTCDVDAVADEIPLQQSRLHGDAQGRRRGAACVPESAHGGCGIHRQRGPA